MEPGWNNHPLYQKDEPRNVKMARMEVVCATESQALPNGNVVYANKPLTIQVYEDEVDQVLAFVEDDQNALERAKEQHTDAFEKYVRQESDGDAELEKRARATYPGSVEAKFHAITGRHMKPLKSAKVVERGLPPPQQEKQSAANLEAVEMLVGKLLEAAPELAAVLSNIKRGKPN